MAGQLAGVASYEITGHRREAEIAFAVADHMHHRGIATLLLEHLVSRRPTPGRRDLQAADWRENAEMLQVFADAGLPVRRELETA